MGSKSSSAPAPDPQLVQAQLRSMGIQDTMLQKFMASQDLLTPIQMQEMTKGIERADKQYAYDIERQDRLDKQAVDQFGFTSRYNEAALQAQKDASAGANAASMLNATTNSRVADSNAKLADSSIKLNDYQYGQMQERDKRWREVGMPQEDALIDKVNEMGSDKYKQKQLGTAVADVNQSFGDSRAQTIREMARRGMDGGGAAGAVMARGNADQALALAGTKNKTRQGLEQMDLANKFQLNGALKGMVGLGDMSAGLATQSINAGKQGYGGGGGGGGGGFGAIGFGGSGGGGGGPQIGLGLNLANSGASGILGGYQMGNGMAGSMGSNATGMYTTQQNAYTADQNQKGSMFGSFLGAGATLGAAAL